MNSKFHIAFIISHYPHQAFGHDGGLGTSVYNLVEWIRKNNIKVSVFVYGQKDAFILNEENLVIYSLKDYDSKFFKFYFNRKYIEMFINEKIINDNISLIEAPDWTGITAFMNLKAPLVIRFHGSDTYFCHLEKRKQKFKNYWFEKLAIKKAVAFIAPTTFAGAISKELFAIKNKNIQTIHYGLELDKFKNLNPENYEKGLILYIGTIIRKKGVLELPSILNKVREKHPEAHLVLIGGDSYDISTKSDSTWELLQKELKTEDRKSVSYLGKIPYQEVQNYIKKAHVCVFPTFAETLGMVTIEAMAMQKPVVNSAIGWAQELIIDGESGFLVHPKDHDLFSNRIISLMSDPVLVKEMGSKAVERVTAVFDIEKKALENILFYESLIKTS
jgi:glycosyltransferase involved in cell wall biosynthesis